MILPSLITVRTADARAEGRVYLLPALRRAGGPYAGAGRISGTTKVKGTPNLPKRAIVVLVDKRARLPVAETMSNDVTGAYSFGGFDHTRKYLVLGIDPLTQYTAVLADEVVPVVGA